MDYNYLTIVSPKNTKKMIDRGKVDKIVLCCKRNPNDFSLTMILKKY